MRICFTPKRFNASSQIIIAKANIIIEEYMAAGYKLTLRQLYYQFVARDWLENTIKNYNRLGNIISDARLAGEIDWDAIEDRARNLQEYEHWSSPKEMLLDCCEKYARDVWADQPEYVEVWIEKESLIAIVENACTPYRVPHLACKGYLSQSEAFSAGYERLVEGGKPATIIHLGDHDPSGIDMTRDLRDRLNLFAYDSGVEVTVQRIALNFDQIEHWQPPPNPAKSTDSRFRQYRKRFGFESWELDALNPKTLVDLIQAAIQEHLDEETFEESLARENADRKRLKKIANNWKD